MVQYLVEEGYIKSENVRGAFEMVDRADFVPEEYRRRAYFDTPLPIGHGQTISAPSIVAAMLELLEIYPGAKALEIGTGSGYNACLMACAGAEVYTVERLEPLVRMARKNLEKCPCRERVRVLLGDGSMGYPPEAPYSRIMVTCGAPEVPEPLIEQLDENGIMVIPVGGTLYQELIAVKKENGKFLRKYWGDVAFVPMIGRYGHRWA